MLFGFNKCAVADAHRLTVGSLVQPNVWEWEELTTKHSTIR